MSKINFRKLDAEIAVKLFGWSWSEYSDRKFLSPPYGSKESTYATMWDEHGIPHYLPYYSTNNVDALEALSRCDTLLIEKLPNGGYSVSIDGYTGFGCDISIASGFAICKKFGIKKFE